MNNPNRGYFELCENITFFDSSIAEDRNATEKNNGGGNHHPHNQIFGSLKMSLY